jgi:hypothetical protein
MEVIMVQNLDEVMAKIKVIKEEMDVVEFRVLNTRTHIETIEESVKKIRRKSSKVFIQYPVRSIISNQ